MRFVPLIISGLWRRPVRTVFTILSLMLGFLLLGLLQGVDSEFDSAISRQRLDRLLTDPKFDAPMPLSYGPRIQRLPHVTNLTWTTFLPGFYQDPHNNVLVIATSPERFFAVRNEYKASPAQVASLQRTRAGLMVLKKTAERFDWKIGDLVSLKSTVARKDGSSDWSFEIVGTLENPSNPSQIGFAVANFDYFDDARAAGNGTVGRYVVRIDDPRKSAEVSASIDKLFRNSAAPTRTQTENERTQSQLASVGDIKLFTLSVSAAVFFAIVFLTGNTILQSVRERTPELAIMKTLGFSDRRIICIIVSETLALCLVAALCGLGIAASLYSIVSVKLEAFSAYVGGAPLPIEALLRGIVIAVVLTVLSAAIPAWIAARMKIVDALIVR